ncbi:hypothetical protein F4818DRAFT_40277 [Hypoxylon cercidicola]|nr:hypothetical protein F4818DRAFT_40277 [Hypoxylon cercidicola]
MSSLAMSSASERMALTILSHKYEGQELVQQLVTTWPGNIARTVAGRPICSAASVLRLMAIILEDGIQSPKLSPSNALLSLSLAEFPVHPDQQTEEMLSEAISSCIRLFRFSGAWANGYTPNVFETLESELMLKALWSESHNLLYKTSVWADCNGMIDLIEWPVDKIAKAGLIHLRNPEELAATVKNELGISSHTKPDTYVFFNPTPPQFIRVQWNNNSESTLSNDSSVFKSLQTFDLSAQTAQLEGGSLAFHAFTSGYRLICCVKITQSGEERDAPHFYTCDGRYFIPPTPDLNRDWSCNDPGNYYLIYYKSETVQRMSLERAVPFPDADEARRKDLSGTTAIADLPLVFPHDQDLDHMSIFHSFARRPTPVATLSDPPRSHGLPPRLLPISPNVPRKSTDQVPGPAIQSSNVISARQNERGTGKDETEALQPIRSHAPLTKTQKRRAQKTRARKRLLEKLERAEEKLRQQT